MTRIKKELNEFNLLIKSVPPVILTLFVMSVFSMNLLANKSIALPFEWLALDCGIIVSWFAFLTMDILTMHFGPKAANQLSVLAILFNLTFCLIFFIGSKIPGSWGESYVPNCQQILNNALDNTFGGTWYILFGSTVAFTVSAFVNNFLNYSVGKIFKKKPDSFTAYISRAYISTAVGQFVDNFVFAVIVSRLFFGWTLIQCLTCAATGMLAELIFEIIFSFFGFKISSKWKKEKIGEEYLSLRKGAIK